MPKLEPIVNQEEKELQVPTFNKKEIEGIAQEVVDEALSNVSSGTKLYRHIVEITLYIDDEELNTTCIFITTSDQSLKRTKNEVYARGYVSGVVDIFGAGQIYTPIIAITNEDEPALYYLSDNGNLERANFGGPFGNDTVEEL